MDDSREEECIIFRENLGYVQSCCAQLWRGVSCTEEYNPGCICKRWVVSGGIRHRLNYGYTIPFSVRIN